MAAGALLVICVCLFRFFAPQDRAAPPPSAEPAQRVTIQTKSARAPDAAGVKAIRDVREILQPNAEIKKPLQPAGSRGHISKPRFASFGKAMTQAVIGVSIAWQVLSSQF